jgi:NADH-quinone oxidoreductase subunit N
MEIQLILSLPIIIASIFAVLIPVFDAFIKNKSVIFGITLLNFIAVLIIDLFIFTNPIYFSLLPLNPSAGDTFNTIVKQSLNFGGFTIYFELLFALSGILTLFAAPSFLKKNNFELKEFYSLLTFSFLGMMYIAHTNNLLILFLGIELMSIPFYVLSGFFRNNLKSIEASLKYFILGSFATGFLIYGIAFLYGATGSMYLNVINHQILIGQINHTFLFIGLALLFVGLAFKASTFPFHQWAPDVYTGAPTVVTAFMSTAGKAAAFIAFIIVTKSLFLSDSTQTELTKFASSITFNAKELLAIISAMTMLVGNITALMQKNVKRMLAFSSVAHAGYILMGVVANNVTGWSGISFYLTAYLFMQIGAFIIVSLIEKENDEFLNLTDYNGLSKSHPLLAAAMAIFMFSLVGLPPFAGFFGKYYLFLSAIQSGYLWLTIVAVIASIISIYFYIGLIINMYFKERDGEVITISKNISYVSILISVIGVLFFGLFPSYLINLALKLFN